MSKTSITTKSVDFDELPPLMKEVVKMKRKYSDDLILFRVGDFFEAYFEDAVDFSRLTGVSLTAKAIGKKGEKISVPMSGVPHRNLNEYAIKIVTENRRVVVIEQLEDPRTVKGRLVKRGVVRIITSSTVVEDGYIAEYVNNYLCSVSKIGSIYGLCFSDISTGEVHMTSVDSIESVLNELARYKPSELLLDNECYLIFNELIIRRLKLHINITIKDEFFGDNKIFGKIESSFKVSSIDSIKYNHISELHSLYALLCYVEYTQCIGVDYGALPSTYKSDSYMVFDIDTRRNLELCENIIDRKKQGTLLSILDKTSTVMGGRLLRQWIEKPLINQSKIEHRLSSVEELVTNLEVCTNIRDSLVKIFDISRIIGRIKLNKSIPRDLVSLRESLKRLPYIKSELGKLSSPLLTELYTNFNTLEDLWFLLDQSICDDPVSDVREGMVLKVGYNKELDKARDMLSKSGKFLVEMEERERKNTGIRSLKVQNHATDGCVIEVTTPNLNKVPTHYIQGRSLKNSTRYKTEELKELEYDLFSALEQSENLQVELYEEIRGLILLKIKELSIISEILSTLDVLCGFSAIAVENGYIKPELNIDGLLVIRDGRHPVVEKLINSKSFTVNDIEMNMCTERYMLITGPNMAGKSTYMRQVALITIMAHIGCFIPATYGNIPLTDKIFTRIGASDDISSGRSTYMVEMEEVRNILDNATRKSLVLLDEVGRGTSNSDGISIAQSITEYIHNEIGCKTLFATHYHELIGLERDLEGLQNHHMSIERTENDDLVFLHKIKKGGLSDSYGIDVAQLAGLPSMVIERAREILNKVEDKNLDVPDNQGSLNDAIIKEIRSIDKTSINPVSSYKYLKELVERIQDS